MPNSLFFYQVPLKGLSHWRRRRRDCRDWSVAATRATRETKKMACALTKETSRRRLQTRWQPWFARKSRGRLRDVSETYSQLRRRLCDVSGRSPWSPAGLGDVAEMSRTKLVSATSPQLMETSRRRLRDLLETGKVSKKSPQKSNMFEFPATPRRPGWSPGDVAETWVASRSPPIVSRPVR